MSESSKLPAPAHKSFDEVDPRLRALAAASSTNRDGRPNVRVITIRNVHRDRRVWRVGIPAAICSLIALGMLASLQHRSGRFPTVSAQSVRPSPSDMRALEAGSDSKASTRDRQAIRSSSLQLPIAGRPGNHTGNDEIIGRDTFVDYRHREQSTTPVKRVIVYN
jgi:hypothetical protein